MQVLKQGKLPENDVYTAVCNYCDCTVKFERKEAKFVSDQRDGDSLVIVCPTCHREIWTAVRSRMDR